jgi:hypothetical protein
VSATLIKGLILAKHECSKQLADDILDIIQSNDHAWLTEILQNWASPNLVRVGSNQQQLYLTYLAYQLMQRIYFGNQN